MRIWKAIFTVLTIVFGSLGLMNVVSYDIILITKVLDLSK